MVAVCNRLMMWTDLSHVGVVTTESGNESRQVVVIPVTQTTMQALASLTPDDVQFGTSSSSRREEVGSSVVGVWRGINEARFEQVLNVSADRRFVGSDHRTQVRCAHRTLLGDHAENDIPRAFPRRTPDATNQGSELDLQLVEGLVSHESTVVLNGTSLMSATQSTARIANGSATRKMYPNASPNELS